MSLDLHNTTLKDLALIAEKQGQRGTVATAKGLIPWQQGSVTPDRKWRRLPAPTTEQMQAELRKDLPPIVRREARVRFAAIRDRLLADAERSYSVTGRVVWPKSMQDELTALGWKVGNPNFRAQVEDLARKYVEEGARKQRAKDQHKVTLDWSGHTTA
jgi:hypothetical protein